MAFAPRHGPHTCGMSLLAMVACLIIPYGLVEGAIARYGGQRHAPTVLKANHSTHRRTTHPVYGTLTYSDVSDVMKVGNTRPLEVNDITNVDLNRCDGPPGAPQTRTGKACDLREALHHKVTATVCDQQETAAGSVSMHGIMGCGAGVGMLGLRCISVCVCVCV